MKGVISTSTFYEIGSGLELKKRIFFLEVAAGQGVYMWTDYNNNGIKELNEFDIATFKDQAKYIKIYTPTNTYIKTPISPAKRNYQSANPIWLGTEKAV